MVMKTRSVMAREIVVKETLRRRRQEQNAEYWCSLSHDGENIGKLIVCFHEECLKAYHPGCVSDPSVYSGTWICEAHCCCICHQDRSYYCVGCPKALCSSCIGRPDEFVQIEGQKGLCGLCLQLALLTQQNTAHFDVHFNCFRWAWKGITERFCLTQKDLSSAYNRMKAGKFCISGSDSFKNDEDIERCTGKAPMVKRKKLSPGKQIVGWGSRALIDFLKSLDVDVSQALPQQVVTAHIKDYVKNKKLFHPDMKGLIICDTKLQTVLGRKQVKEGEIVKYLDYPFSEKPQSSETRCGLKDKQKEINGNQQVMHPRDSSEKNETMKICPVNEDGIGLEEIKRCTAKVAQGPDNPENLKKHAGQFQRWTPCTSAEAAGAVATTECANNDEGKASKVVPGNQEVMDQNVSSNGSESIAIGPLNDDGTEQRSAERFAVNITEGDQEVVHENDSSERFESTTRGPVNADGKMAEKTETSIAKYTGGPDNPENLMKHAGKFQRRTPCTSAEAAGGAATTECADNDDANVSKVVPGNQEVMDQNVSSSGSKNIAIGPLNDDGSEQRSAERFSVNITEGDQEVMHPNASSERYENTTRGPVNEDGKMAEKTEMSTAKYTEGDKAVADNGSPVDEQLEAVP